MLRSNTKQVKKNILSYIREYDSFLKNYGITAETDNELLAAVYNIFRQEKGPEIERYIKVGRYISEYNMFQEWAQGLPLDGLFCYFYNRSAVDDLGKILQETESEKERYTEAQAETMLTKLIYREIVTAYNKTL